LIFPKRQHMSFDSMPDLVRPTSLDRAFRGTQAITFNIFYVQVGSIAIETNPLHAFIAFSFFALIGFIQIRYPENPSPFQLHPKTTILSIATFLLSCLPCWVGSSLVLGFVTLKPSCTSLVHSP